MLLTEILTPDRIKIPLTATEKTAVLAEMVDILVAAGDVTQRDKVLQAVMEREQTRTTGIGNGLALPHGKSAGVRELTIAIGKPAAPIEFQSTDARPVSLLFLLVSPPDKTGPHIQALAHISRLVALDANRIKLQAASSPQEMYDLIKAIEKTL